MRLLIIILSILAFVSDSYASDPVDVLSNFYKSVDTLQGDFIQKSTIKDLKKTMTYTGRFYMQKGNLHVKYLGDKPHFIYINNKEMIIYKPSEKTAYQTPFDETKYGQTPIALISGLSDIKSDFSIKKISEKRLSLTPLKGMGHIQNIEITINEGKDFPIDIISMLDKAGNRIELTFKKVIVNGELDNKIFRFLPSGDITIIQ